MKKLENRSAQGATEGDAEGPAPTEDAGRMLVVPLSDGSSVDPRLPRGAVGLRTDGTPVVAADLRGNAEPAAPHLAAEDRARERGMRRMASMNAGVETQMRVRIASGGAA